MICSVATYSKNCQLNSKFKCLAANALHLLKLSFIVCVMYGTFSVISEKNDLDKKGRELDKIRDVVNAKRISIHGIQAFTGIKE